MTWFSSSHPTPQMYNAEEAKQFQALRELFQRKVIDTLAREDIEESMPDHLQLGKKDELTSQHHTVMQTTLRDHQINPEAFKNNMLGGQLQAIAQRIATYQTKFHDSFSWWSLSDAIPSNHPTHMFCETIKAYLASVSQQHTFTEHDLHRIACWFDFIGSVAHGHILDDKLFEGYEALFAQVALALCAPSSLGGQAPIYDLLRMETDTRPIQDDLKQLKHHIEGILKDTPMAVLKLVSAHAIPDEGSWMYRQDTPSGEAFDTSPGREIVSIVHKIRETHKSMLQDEAPSCPKRHRVVHKQNDAWLLTQPTAQQSYVFCLDEDTLSPHINKILGLVEWLNDVWVLCHLGHQIAQRGGDILTYWFTEGALQAFLEDIQCILTSLQDTTTTCLQITQLAMLMQISTPVQDKKARATLTTWQHNHQQAQKALDSTQWEINQGLSLTRTIQDRYTSWQTHHRRLWDETLRHQHAFLNQSHSLHQHLLSHQLLENASPHHPSTPALPAPTRSHQAPQGPITASDFFESVASMSPDYKSDMDNDVRQACLAERDRQIQITRYTRVHCGDLFESHRIASLLTASDNIPPWEAFGLQLDLAYQHATYLTLPIDKKWQHDLVKHCVDVTTHDEVSQPNGFFITQKVRDAWGATTPECLIQDILTHHGPTPWVALLGLPTEGPSKAHQPWSKAHKAFIRFHAITQVVNSLMTHDLKPTPALRKLAHDIGHPWALSPNTYQAFHTHLMHHGQSLYHHLHALENPQALKAPPAIPSPCRGLQNAICNMGPQITWHPWSWRHLLSPWYWQHKRQKNCFLKSIRPLLAAMGLLQKHTPDIFDAWHRALIPKDTLSTMDRARHTATGWYRALHNEACSYPTPLVHSNANRPPVHASKTIPQCHDRMQHT